MAITIDGATITGGATFTGVASPVAPTTTTTAAPTTTTTTAAPTPTDASFAYVPLLLNTGSTNGQQNNTFLDSSTNNFTITRNGTPTQGSRTPYWPNGQWSNYFNGNGDYLTFANNAVFSFTADFTVEAWVYRVGTGTGTSVYESVIGGNQSTTAYWNLYVNSSNNTIVWYGDDSVLRSTSNSITNNTWNHIAVSRTSGVLKIFINGVEGYSASVATSYSLPTNGGRISFDGPNGVSTGNKYFFGYISNLRVVKGVGVYTGAFTPPTSPLQTTQSSGTNISAITGTQTSLLTCQSNRFRDNSSNAFLIATFGTPSVQAFQPFSPAASYSAATYAGSGYFNGSTDYLSVPDANEFLITGDFTIEAWVYQTSSKNVTIVGQWPITGVVSFICKVQSSGKLGFTYDLGAGGVNGANSTNAITYNSWNHVVWSRSGSTQRYFINGVLDSTTNTISGSFVNSAGALTIGLYNTGDNTYFNGYLSNIRFVKGAAVYTANFTPPTTPVTNTAQTSLLLNMANAGIYDAAAQNNITTFGNAQVSTAVTAKWPPSSMRFNGSPDYLLTPIPSLIGAFTIEFWVYRPASGNNWFFTIGDAISGSGSLEVYIGSSGTAFNLWVNNATRITSSTLPTVGAWNYVAVTRDASNEIKFYLNGTQLSPSPTYTSSAAFATTLRLGVEFYNSGLSYGNCYIQDFRITNGVARTIATPTTAFPTQ